MEKKTMIHKRISYLRFVGNDEGFTEDSYMERLKAFFLEASRIQNLSLSLSYYFPGNRQEQVELYLSAGMEGREKATEFIDYTDRIFDTMHFSREPEPNDCISKLTSGLPHGNRIEISNHRGILMAPNLPLHRQKLLEMSEKLFHLNQQLLLRISLQVISKKQSSALLPALHAIGAMVDLQNPNEVEMPLLFDWVNLNSEMNGPLLDIQRSLFNFKIEIFSKEKLCDRTFSILRQGLGGKLFCLI